MTSTRTHYEPPKSIAREERSLNPFAHFTFGNPIAQQEAMYIQVRIKQNQDRWEEGYDRLLREEKAAWSLLRDEHVEVIADLKRNTRMLHWTLMADFEHLCELHMTTVGVAADEEHERCQLYEAWLEDYERTVPAQKKWEVDRTADLVRQQYAAKRARQAYEEHLITLDEIDMCRRDETRGRMKLYQAWHDTVVVSLRNWHVATFGLLELYNLEMYLRCELTLVEEDIREAELSWYEQDIVKGCWLAEEYGRSVILQEELQAREEELVRGALHTLQYEMWYMTAKDVPRRWLGETLAEPDSFDLD